MRELVYVPIVHDIPTFVIDENDEEGKKRAALFSQKLEPVFALLTERVLKMHERRSFQRVYFDGCIKPAHFFEHASQYPTCLPLLALTSRAAELMPTEHEVSTLLPFFLGCSDESSFEERQFAWEYIAKIKNWSMPEFRTFVKDIFDCADLSSLLSGKFEDFFLGLDYADFHAARELWIGRNVDKSLGEKERGILFFGVNHSYDRVKSTITSPTNHVCYDFFKFKNFY